MQLLPRRNDRLTLSEVLTGTIIVVFIGTWVAVFWKPQCPTVFGQYADWLRPYIELKCVR